VGSSGLIAYGSAFHQSAFLSVTTLPTDFLLDQWSSTTSCFFLSSNYLAPARDVGASPLTSRTSQAGQEDFVGLFKFVPVFIAALWVVGLWPLRFFLRCYEGQKLLILIWGLLFFRFAESSVVSLPLGLLEIPTISPHVPKVEHLKHLGPLGSFFSSSSGSTSLVNFFLNLSFFINLLTFLASMATASSSSLSVSSSEEALLLFLAALRAIVFAFLTGGREYS
jgi:hypothetical protein